MISHENPAMFYILSKFFLRCGRPRKYIFDNLPSKRLLMSVFLAFSSFFSIISVKRLRQSYIPILCNNHMKKVNLLLRHRNCGSGGSRPSDKVGGGGGGVIQTLR